MDSIDVVIRLVVATALGAALGLEREYDGQDAGFRTHVLLVLGSALFAVSSVAGFDAFVNDRASTNISVDITRIAAYVAPGVGFIGGGAIVKVGAHARGMTTAASLWTAAAIGVAAGLGFWVGAVTTTVLALFALEGLQPLGHLVHQAGRRRRHARSAGNETEGD